MGKGLFKSALSEMHQRSLDIYGPKSFSEYRKESGYNVNTAAAISIDSIEELNPLLRSELIMVFRLGSIQGNCSTRFALRKMNSLSEFFIIQKDHIIDKRGMLFTPLETKNLLSFSVLPSLAEGSLINLGFASGLIQDALNLSEISSPAVVNSTFTFKLKLHSDDEAIQKHIDGQIEIDAVFFGSRGNKTKLFIIEAKSGRTQSLAKHKLAYPVFALANNIDTSVEIIPLYLKVEETEDFYHYHFIECSFPDPRIEIRAINELQAKNHLHYKLKKSLIKRV